MNHGGVPYHYGRWIYSSRYGWLWVPPRRGFVYWGPGYVGWVYTPDYVCWVPLAPYETYYGYGYYGPYSVNILQVKNINVTNIVFVNAKVLNGYTVIEKKHFVSGKHIYTKISENPFISRKATFGRPEIELEKLKKQPIGLEIVTHEKIPPKNIRNKDVKTLRERKPLIIKESPKPIKPDVPPTKEKIIKKKVDNLDVPITEKDLKPSRKIQERESKKGLEKEKAVKPAKQQKEEKGKIKKEKKLRKKEQLQKREIEKEKVIDEKRGEEKKEQYRIKIQ